MIRDVKNRTKLQEVIPLKMPFVCHIEVTNVCNFKCEFCASTDNPKYSKIKKGFMEYNLFCKVVDDLSCFGEGIRLKQLIFHILGEPLLHPQIAEMIAYAKKKNVAEKLILYTNGSKLTPELSRKIVDAGIDIIQISIEHVTSEGYEKIAHIKLDYDNLLSNIGYLYAYKKDNCFVSAKILDCNLSQSEKEKFFIDFERITSECHIETLMQTVPADIKDTTLGIGRTTTNDGYEAIPKSVCTLPFYILGVSYDGLVSPCVCDWSKELIIGDINKNALKDIWEGNKMKKIRIMQLTKNREKHGICGRCESIYNQIDNIDDYADMLIKKFETE